MMNFRKRLTPEIIAEINEMIIQEAYIDECERAEVERKFSLAKLKYGMGLVKANLENTVGHVVAMSILLLKQADRACSANNLRTYSITATKKIK